VPDRARRRTFTAAYKVRVLADYDAARDGDKGAVLRREGLYSSHVVDWRRARDAGALAGLTVPRGRPRHDPRDSRIHQLQQEKARLEQELARGPLRGPGESWAPRSTSSSSPAWVPAWLP
jgi:transposase